MVKGITTIIGMIPKGGRYAKSVVNFVHEIPQNWEKFKSAIKQIDDLLKIGKLKLDGKQKTIFESNKNILKNHEKVTTEKAKYDDITKKMWKDRKEYPPFNTSKEDFTKGWTPTVVERQNLRNIYKELDPPASKYTKEMEAIDEELNELMLYGRGKYSHLGQEQKTELFNKLQAEMKRLIDIAKKEDLSTLSLSQLNKKSQDLQRRIREIADNPNIKGTVNEGPKRDMIKALYDSEHPGLTNARNIIQRKNAEKKYGTTFPRLDPENDSFIIMYLDEVGNPVKMSRFTGKFSATKNPITGELTRKEGTAWWDRWDPKKNKMREEGKEVWHETIDREGKTIMSNPEYKLPKTENMELQNEFYTNLSTSDLAKKGYSLKQIDMITKGREARKYLEKTQNPDVNIRMHEQTSTNEIGGIMEDLYTRGDDVYKLSIDEWIKKIPEYFAGGGRVAYGEGSEKKGIMSGVQDFLGNLGWEGIGEELRRERQMMKIAFDIIPTFTYPDHVSETSEQLKRYKKQMGYADTGNFVKDLGLAFTLGAARKPGEQWEKYRKFLEMENYEKANLPEGFATGGVSNLFRQRQGYRTGNIAKLPEFLKFVEKLLIKASNEIRQGIGKWKGLDQKQRIVQHDNLTKLATEFQKTKKFDVRINEYTGIDAEKAFIEARAKVKSPVKKDRVATADELDDYIEILDPTGEAGVVEEGMTIKALDKMVAEEKAYEADMYRQYMRGDLDKYVKPEVLEASRLLRQKKIDKVLDKAYDEVFYQKPVSGDYKYDADVLAESIAEQLGKVYADLPQTHKSEIYNTALNRIQQDLQINRAKKIAQKDLADIEQKVELQMFDPKGKKGNAEGGLIPGYATGGVSDLFRRR